MCTLQTRMDTQWFCANLDACCMHFKILSIITLDEILLHLHRRTTAWLVKAIHALACFLFNSTRGYMPTFPCMYAQTDRPEYSKKKKNISNYGVMQVELLSRYIMGFPLVKSTKVNPNPCSKWVFDFLYFPALAKRAVAHHKRETCFHSVRFGVAERVLLWLLFWVLFRADHYINTKHLLLIQTCSLGCAGVLWNQVVSLVTRPTTCIHILYWFGVRWPIYSTQLHEEANIHMLGSNLIKTCSSQCRPWQMEFARKIYLEQPYWFSWLVCWWSWHGLWHLQW